MVRKSFRVLVLLSLLSLPFYAYATIADAISPNSVQWFSPIHVTAQFSTTASSPYVKVTGIKYSQSTINKYFEFSEINPLVPKYNELEFRANTSTYWNGMGTLYSNLPGAYKEYDSDDVSIGCFPGSAYSTTTYYGTLYLNKRSNPSTSPVLFESEYGSWYYIDGIPELYETIFPTLNHGTARSW